MLISCIMPTRGRPQFVCRALEAFFAQTWPWKELVILDDRDCRSFDHPPLFQSVQYHLLEQRLQIGAKRNLAVSRAAGQIIAHWDDDDYSAPGRLEDQVMHLIDSAAMVTGYHSMTFVDGERLWLYRHTPPYAIGSSMMYRREFWREHPFPDQQIMEDQHFQAAANSMGVLVSVEAGEMMLASIHPDNTSPRTPMASNNWSIHAPQPGLR